MQGGSGFGCRPRVLSSIYRPSAHATAEFIPPLDRVDFRPRRAGSAAIAAPTLARFYLIERYLQTGILLPFDTLERRRYDVQSTTNFAALQQPVDVHSPDWTTVYSIGPLPFPDHYIHFEPTTNTPGPAARFYRIVVTP